LVSTFEHAWYATAHACSHLLLLLRFPHCILSLSLSSLTPFHHKAYERVARGGAIAALSDGVLRVSDSVFSSNRAAVCPPFESGGAGSQSGGSNSAQPRQQLQCGSGSGGAIALQRSGAWLDRVVFENNVAEAGGQGGGSLGGAVSISSISDSTYHSMALSFLFTTLKGQLCLPHVPISIFLLFFFFLPIRFGAPFLFFSFLTLLFLVLRSPLFPLSSPR